MPLFFNMKQRAGIKELLLLLLLLLPLHHQAYAETVPPCMPLTGEHLKFNFGWEFINAGSATMDVLATGANSWQIKTFARTNKFLDIFKKVRDHITAEGICVHGKMQSTLFDAKLQERKYSAIKRTDFLWKENKVRYTQPGNQEYFHVKRGHLSVMDAFFSIRQYPLKPGTRLQIPIFDSGEKYNLEITVLKKTKKIKAPWGKRVECIVLQPKLKTAAIFTQPGKMTLWLTNDSRHIPLKMAAKLKFGRILAKLVDYRKATSSPM